MLRRRTVAGMHGDHHLMPHFRLTRVASIVGVLVAVVLIVPVHAAPPVQHTPALAGLPNTSALAAQSNDNAEPGRLVVKFRDGVSPEGVAAVMAALDVTLVKRLRSSGADVVETEIGRENELAAQLA